MLPLTVSDLPWWGWLLSAAVIYLLARYFIARLEKAPMVSTGANKWTFLRLGIGPWHSSLV
jgi:hypothetical protein